MQRRQLLKAAGASALVPAFPVLASAPRRRVRPGDPAWPDESAWRRLGDKVGGRLIRPTPVAAACEADVQSAACKALFKDLANPYYLGDQPGGTQVSGWADAWTPKVSAYAVAARTSADVAAAVDFARVHNLRLTIKGGGHSYQGGSNAADSLLIWTRAMNDITVHDAFTPQGVAAAPAPAVSIGSGAMWVDAYDAVTTKAGRYVQGGGCATVGVAGLVLGGGFGSFSKRFGLAAGSLLEAEIVTADGAVRTVNAVRHPDLYWALKGGGQSDLGVVTRLTLRTHELPAMAGGCFGKITAASDEAFRRLIGAFVDLYADNLCNPHWGESANINSDNTISVGMVFQGLTEEEAKAAWAPMAAFTNAAGKDISTDGPHILARPMRKWWDFAADRAAHMPFERYDTRPVAPADHAWWSGDSEQVSMYLHGYESLWLPASLLARDQRRRLADALMAASRHFSVALHFNKGLAGARSEVIAEARSAATNPTVTEAFALAIIATGGLPDYRGYPPPDLAKAREHARRIDAATAVLRPLAPAGGSYVSESNYFNRDWRHAFWGENYPRLAAIKARYDPAGLFVMHHGVGSEAWSDDGFERL